MPDAAPFLVALPGGLMAGGVASWAVRLVNRLAARGRRVGLILHASGAGHAAVRVDLDPRVRVTDLTHLPALDSGEDPVRFVGAYLGAVRTLGPGPVVVSPNMLGDCYGLFAAVSRECDVRVVGWLHNDIPYEYRVQQHYEAVISAFVPVSRRLEEACRACLPGRAADIARIGHGVDVPSAVPTRGALAGRAVRLVYAGRMDEGQKRVMALPVVAASLAARGVACELVLVGDGPAGEKVERAIVGLPGVVRLPAQPHAGVMRLLEAADIAVLASRHEGLSVSMIEALSRGCVPVMTRTPSGSDELVRDGETGVLVDVGDDADDVEVGRALAAGVVRAMASIGAMARNAHADAAARFSLDGVVDKTAVLIDAVAGRPGRAWPEGARWEFTGGSGGSGGTVPPDAASRLREALRALGGAGRRVIIHGTGRHTRELVGVIEEGWCEVVAFSDDDPGQAGRTLLGRPIVTPADVAGLGATDVVISSFINQDAIWTRRAAYERAGLVVHRLYAGATPRASSVGAGSSGRDSNEASRP